ncbi:MAG TPA: nucleotide exchange factor GrpE [Clostridiales bacterium]|nr:nucleotide exchange factor GrpE [Clostridiales bacterium]
MKQQKEDAVNTANQTDQTEQTDQTDQTDPREAIKEAGNPQKTETCAGEEEGNAEALADGDLAAENESLKTELEALTAARAEEADQLLRLTAEFDNFRRRTLKEKDDLRLTANADLLSALLPVLDNFDRALLHAENSPILEGIQMVQKQLIDILNSNGLIKVGNIGEAFDPKIHDAIMQEEKEGAACGTILEVLQPGYCFHDKLLRAAMVKVAK